MCVYVVSVLVVVVVTLQNPGDCLVSMLVGNLSAQCSGSCLTRYNSSSLPERTDLKVEM